MLTLNSNEKFILQNLQAFDLDQIANAEGKSVYQVDGPAWYRDVQHFTGLSPIGARTVTAYMEKKGLLKVFRPSQKKPVRHISLTADAMFLANQINHKGHGDYAEVLPSGRTVLLTEKGRGSL